MSATIPPIAFAWDGETFRPRYPKIVDRHYVIGETYMLAPHEQRSQASHNHEFAWIGEAWKNLPEHLADQFPSPQHLRKRALIDAGYYHETIIDVGSNAAALRVAADMRTIADFAAIVVRGHIVVRRVAKSQSRRAMEPAEFQASKQAILDVISAMIGVDGPTLLRNTAVAA